MSMIQIHYVYDQNLYEKVYIKLNTEKYQLFIFENEKKGAMWERTKFEKLVMSNY